MPLINGAQREPSMEEILASIRRIIEDSDTGKAPGDADFTPRAPEFKAVPDVEAFRAEFREAALSQQSEPAVDKVPTMAELKVQLGYERAHEAEMVAPVVAEDPVSAPEAVVAAKATEPAPPVSSPASQHPRYNFDPTDDLDLDLDLEPAPPVVVEQPVSAVPVKTVEPAEAVAPQDNQVVKPAIISQHASRQVAAAFGELSDAFAARSKKTFDDLAEEMMRPMLQDWLDNNLPVLVERLVREEIERVARGAQ